MIGDFDVDVKVTVASSASLARASHRADGTILDTGGDLHVHRLSAHLGAGAVARVTRHGNFGAGAVACVTRARGREQAALVLHLPAALADAL
jgi:hypothetical protein